MRFRQVHGHGHLASASGQTHKHRLTVRESATSLTGLPASLSRIPLCTAYCPITGLFCSGFLQATCLPVQLALPLGRLAEVVADLDASWDGMGCCSSHPEHFHSKPLLLRRPVTSFQWAAHGWPSLGFPPHTWTCTATLSFALLTSNLAPYYFQNCTCLICLLTQFQIYH